MAYSRLKASKLWEEEELVPLSQATPTEESNNEASSRKKAGELNSVMESNEWVRQCWFCLINCWS